MMMSSAEVIMMASSAELSSSTIKTNSSLSDEAWLEYLSPLLHRYCDGTDTSLLSCPVKTVMQLMLILLVQRKMVHVSCSTMWHSYLSKCWMFIWHRSLLWQWWSIMWFSSVIRHRCLLWSTTIIHSRPIMRTCGPVSNSCHDCVSSFLPNMYFPQNAWGVS